MTVAWGDDKAPERFGTKENRSLEEQSLVVRRKERRRPAGWGADRGSDGQRSKKAG